MQAPFSAIHQRALNAQPCHASIHSQLSRVRVAQAQQASTDQEQRHEYNGASLAQVPTEGRDEVDEQLGGGLEVAVEGGLVAQPRLCRECPEVRVHAAQDGTTATSKLNGV